LKNKIGKSFGKNTWKFGKQAMKSGFNKRAMKPLGKQLFKNVAKDTYKFGKNSIMDKIKRGRINLGYSNHQNNGGMEGNSQKAGGSGMQPYPGNRRYPGKVGMQFGMQFSGSGRFKPYHLNVGFGGQQTSF
jgi:hypothetical protein